MGIVYSTQFEIFPRGGDSAGQTYSRLKQALLSWADSSIRRQLDTRLPSSVAVPKFEPAPISGGRVSPLPGYSIEVANASAADGSGIWRVVYTIPDPEHPHLDWVATGSTTLDGETLELDFSLDVKPTSYVVAPRGISPGTPNVVRTVIDGFDCRAGGVRLSGTPMILHADDIPRFVTEVLPTPNRLPIVLLSAGNPRRPFRSEEELAFQLLGLAHVYGLDNFVTEDRLIEVLGNKGLACFGGGVRTYWPGFSALDPASRHRVASPELIASLGSAGFARRLRASLTRLAAASYLNGEHYRAVKKRIEDEVRERNEERYDALRRRSQNADELQARVDELLSLVTEKDALNRVLGDTIRAQDDRNRDLETRLREAVYSERTEAGDEPPIEEEESGERVSPFPWPIDNPEDRAIDFSPTFEDDLKVLFKDGNLRAEFLVKVNGILRDPTGVGKPMSAPRTGQRTTHVSHNYRLIWTPLETGVRLELFCSKEDRRYSPFGA